MAQNSKSLYLQKAYLEGYNTIKGLEVNFKPGLNIIIGKNGSGKTNLFDFLYHALSLNYEGFFDFKTKIVLANGKSIKVSANNKSTQNLVETNQLIYDIDDSVDFELKIDDTVEVKSINRKEVSKRLAGAKVNYSQSFIKYGIPLINSPIFDSPYSFKIDRKKGNTEIYGRIRNADTPDLLRNLFASLIFELEFVKHSDLLTLQNTLVDCFGVIPAIKPYLAENTDVKDIRVNKNYNLFTANGIDEITVNNYFLEYKANNDWMPFSNLSDGTKRLFYIIAEIAFNNLNVFGSKTIIKFGPSISSDKIRLFENRIILFEEPELGIHPHQLQKLLQFIKGQALNKQIIISTHSPIVLDMVGKNELDRIQIALLTSKGTQLRKMTSKEIKKAQIYMEDTGLLSDYWRFSDLEA